MHRYEPSVVKCTAAKTIATAKDYHNEKSVLLWDIMSRKMHYYKGR